MSDHDRFRGQDLYNEHDREHDDEDGPSAMQQDQGGRVPDHGVGPDYVLTPGWGGHPSDVGSGAPPPPMPPPPAREWDADADADDDDDRLGDDDQIADDAPESDW